MVRTVDTLACRSTRLKDSALADPSLQATGETHIPGVWNPVRDTTLTPAQRFSTFSEWVSYYFPPTGFDATVDSDTPGISEALVARADAPMHKASDQWTPTIHRMDARALREVCHFEVMARSQRFYHIVEPAVYRANVRRAMLEGRPGAGLIWPGVRVVVVWCDMTNSDVVSGVMKVKARVKRAREAGEGRDVVFRKLEGANHFVSALLDEVRKRSRIDITGAVGLSGEVHVVLSGDRVRSEN